MMKSVALLILLAGVATARSTPQHRFNRGLALKQFENNTEPIDDPDGDVFEFCIELCIALVDPEDLEIPFCAILPYLPDIGEFTLDVCTLTCLGAAPLCVGECPCNEEIVDHATGRVEEVLPAEFPNPDENTVFSDEEFELCFEECAALVGPEDLLTPVCGFLPWFPDVGDLTLDICSLTCIGGFRQCDGECPCNEEELPVDFPNGGEGEEADDTEAGDIFELCLELCIAVVDPEDLEIPFCGSLPWLPDIGELTLDICSLTCLGGFPQCVGECPCNEEFVDNAIEEVLPVEFPNSENPVVGDEFEVCFEECAELVGPEELEKPVCGFLPWFPDIGELTLDICSLTCIGGFSQCDGECPCDEEEPPVDFPDDTQAGNDPEFLVCWKACVAELDDPLGLFLPICGVLPGLEEPFQFPEACTMGCLNGLPLCFGECSSCLEDVVDNETELPEEIPDGNVGEDVDGIDMTFEDLAALLAEREKPQVNVHIEQVIDVSS